MSDLERLRTMVKALLADGESLPTPKLIRDQIEGVRAVCPSVSDAEAEQLARDFEAIHDVSMSLGVVLEEGDFEPWLDDAKERIDPFYWLRYKEWLGSADFSAQVLASLDNVTDRVLGLMGNPNREGNWDRRGMVVGHVQSGKTANYVGLISKAADAGYKVIIVIAGLHNNLRNQTQARVDEGFVGFDSAQGPASRRSDGIVGVGNFNSSRRPATFTNTLRDFNTETAKGVGVPLVNLTEPAVFVIKKNTHTLRNLLGWLEAHNARRGMAAVPEPILLIDDEADNASINISKGRDEVSRINGQIRELLKLFERSTYVGYTATPFANIFVDPEDEDEMVGQDLFPRDFIVSLDPPNNYFGPKSVFGEEGVDSVVNYIEDNEDWLPIKHRIDHRVVGLSDSIRGAIRAFIVSRAFRILRGQRRKHCSMLVNVSRFTNVQRQVRDEIHTFLEDIKGSVRVNGATARSAERDPEIRALREAFQSYLKSGVSESWDRVLGVLNEAVSPIKAVEVNSRSSGSLDYAEHSKGLSVIAVGGFSLSRGLTLEGLVISYFLRNSMMYDTLMQMGRWFGYRSGYQDLCRVWMPEEAAGWYSHIAESVEELREELRRMEAANATPKDFGLKVRSHPDTLIVTARNKMGTGQVHRVAIDLSNRLVETTVLHPDEARRIGNYHASTRLAEHLRDIGLAPTNSDREEVGYLVRNAPVKAVANFLSAFENHPGSLLSDPDPVMDYIERRAEEELSKWDICFVGLQRSSKLSLVDSGLGFDLVCQRRAEWKRGVRGALYVSKRQRVSSRGVEKVGLTLEEVKDAQSQFRDENDGSQNYPDWAYRKCRKRPLLLIHLLAIGEEGDDLSGQSPHVAWSISFPKTDIEEEKVEYVVNSRWFIGSTGDPDFDDDTGGDDE